MELYAGAALTGMGYLLNKQRDGLRRTNGNAEARDTPSMKNVYASDHWSAVRKDELRRSTEMHANAQAPFHTGVVPTPAYASMFAGEELQKTFTGKPRTVTSLTGEEIPVEHFQHNNMQPFFRSKVTQNVSDGANNMLLENFTGRNELLQAKQEAKCFFDPTPDLTNVCGMPNNSDFYLDRIVKPIVRNNDFPIEQVRVAPGLNLGFTNKGTGGFQQQDTLQYARDRSIDETRPLSRPKVTLPSRAQAPAASQIGQRGIIGEVAKNRTEKVFEQTPDQWLKTTGANTRESGRPVNIVKPTARVDSHTEYTGAATAAATQPGKGADYDYGKSGITVYDNERQTTQTKTVVSNLTSVVKAIVAPFLDVLRHTPKDYTLDAAREFGNMQAQIPSKPALIDPVDGAMRTTIKETTEDAAHELGFMHAQIPEKPTLYDPVNHIMRTTIKETTIHDTTVANLKGRETGPVNADDEAKRTVRETLPVEDTTRNMNGATYRVVMYSPDAVAKTTVKETTETPASEFGFMNPFNAEGAYNYIEVKIPHTQKEFVSDYEYYGDSKSVNDFRPMSQDADRNAEIDETREHLNIAGGHTPGAGGAYTGLNPDEVNQDTKKALIDSIAPRTTGNVSRVMQTAPIHMSGCELTRGLPSALNGNQDRLDAALLNSLKTNPYNLNVNPIGN